jgi:hypothetical protein
MESMEPKYPEGSTVKLGKLARKRAQLLSSNGAVGDICTVRSVPIGTCNLYLLEDIKTKERFGLFEDMIEKQIK